MRRRCHSHAVESGGGLDRLATAGTGPVATFALNTGANALLGDNRGGVVDNGNVDCDGDGNSYPNMISGAKHGGTTPPRRA